MSKEINIVDKLINRHAINSLDLDQLINNSVNELCRSKDEYQSTHLHNKILFVDQLINLFINNVDQLINLFINLADQ